MRETHSVGEMTAFPSGAHITAVEVDTLTGEVTVLRFVELPCTPQRVWRAIDNACARADVV